MTDNNNNSQIAMRHITDAGEQCNANFAAMIYDPNCARCKKVSIVVMLRRKTVANGCSQQEATVATQKATKLIETYHLLRGEIADREYDNGMIAKRTTIQQAYAKSGRGRRTKMSQYSRKTDESQLF